MHIATRSPRRPTESRRAVPVSRPGDPHERAADRLAADVLSGPRWPADSGPGPTPTLLSAYRSPVAHDLVGSSGRPLEAPVRHQMERRFGHDFSDVRVHTDGQAASSSRRLHARAFTAGHDMGFARGEYAPQSSRGQQVLAHELAHVVANDQAGATGSAVAPVSRFYSQDCDEKDRPDIRTADGIATAMAKKAVTDLTAYQSNDTDQKITDLLIDSFGFQGAGPFLGVVLKAFTKVRDAFNADDYTYECEDDCDSANAYVYNFWTDIHLCMNKMSGKNTTWMAGVMLHEMTHYAVDTGDVEYFYSGTRATTSLHPTDAIANADGYESFAEENYK